MKAFIKKLINRIRTFRKWRRSVWKKKAAFTVSFADRLKYGIKGFNANEIVWYDLKHNDCSNYIADYERIRSRGMNGEYKFILDDKLIFEEIFRNYVRVPAVYAWVSDGNVYGLHEYAVNNENVIDFIRALGRSVLKWENGYEGKGTFVITAAEDGSFDVNGKTKAAEEVKKMFSHGNDSAILCEYMIQSKFENSLYPYSTNTLRIICAKKKGEKSAHIVKAAQRIGNEVSKPVDNVSAGAMVCTVDLETGTLSRGVIAKAHSGDGKIRFFDTHPDTGAQLTGRVIPGWDKLKNDIVELTNRFPYLNLVGWDVLLTEDGFCIIEGNASAGLTMFQMEHGVRSEEIGDIYRSYGIIK